MQRKAVLNSVEFQNRVSPFEGKSDGKVYLTRRITDENGKIISDESEEDQMPLDSKEGAALIEAVVVDLLGRKPTREEVGLAERFAKARAQFKKRKDPTRLITWSPKAESAEAGDAKDVFKVALPTDVMRLFLNTRNQLMVEFTDETDGRILPFNHPVVKGELFGVLREKLGRTPTPQEFNLYLLRCSRESLNEYRSLNPDEKSEFSDREMLVIAILGLLTIRKDRGEGAFKGTQAELLENLKEVVKIYELDDSEWPPAGRHFSDFLWSVKGTLYNRKVMLIYRRSNGKRLIIVRWVGDPEPPEENKGPVTVSPVPPSAAKKVTVAALEGTPDLTEPEEVNRAIDEDTAAMEAENQRKRDSAEESSRPPEEKKGKKK